MITQPAHTMTHQEDIAGLQRRIAKAESDRDMARSAGAQEQYLASYVLVEALDLQLAAQVRKPANGQGCAGHSSTLSTTLSDPVQPANPDAPVVDAANDRESSMTEFGVTYNGRDYEYRGYRYGSLADAVNYAKLRRADPLGDQEEVSALPGLLQVEPPDPRQRALMAELDISFDDGIYRLAEYRYDHLADAVDYARRLRK